MEQDYEAAALHIYRICHPYAEEAELTAGQHLEIEIISLYLRIAYHDGVSDGLARASIPLQGE